VYLSPRSIVSELALKCDPELRLCFSTAVEGPLQGLYQLNVNLQDARFLFLTHLHPDH